MAKVNGIYGQPSGRKRESIESPISEMHVGTEFRSETIATSKQKLRLSLPIFMGSFLAG